MSTKNALYCVAGGLLIVGIVLGVLHQTGLAMVASFFSGALAVFATFRG